MPLEAPTTNRVIFSRSGLVLARWLLYIWHRKKITISKRFYLTNGFHMLECLKGGCNRAAPVIRRLKMARESKVAARNRWMFEMFEKAIKEREAECKVEVIKKHYGNEWVVGRIEDTSITRALVEEVR